MNTPADRRQQFYVARRVEVQCPHSAMVALHRLNTADIASADSLSGSRVCQAGGAPCNRDDIRWIGPASGPLWQRDAGLFCTSPPID
jgi:hypothetical protein